MISPIRCPYAPSLLLPVVCRQIALDFFSLKGRKKGGKRQQKGRKKGEAPRKENYVGVFVKELHTYFFSKKLCIFDFYVYLCNWKSIKSRYDSNTN
jgi:hypothetical protein